MLDNLDFLGNIEHLGNLEHLASIDKKDINYGIRTFTT